MIDVPCHTRDNVMTHMGVNYNNNNVTVSGVSVRCWVTALPAWAWRQFVVQDITRGHVWTDVNSRYAPEI